MPEIDAGDLLPTVGIMEGAKAVLDTYLPTEDMVAASALAREQNPSEPVDAVTADIVNRRPLALETVVRMWQWFTREGKVTRHKSEDEWPPHRVAWESWGGVAGYEFTKGIVELLKIEAAKHIPLGVDRPGWLNKYLETVAQTGNTLMARLAADGMEARARILGAKSADDGDDAVTVGGWAILFSDGENKDRQGTYFTNLTKLYLDYYPSAPLFWEHGRDPVYGAVPLGRRTNVQVYPAGVWMEHKLDATHPQYQTTVADARSNQLGYSTDSIFHLVASGYSSDGRLDIWPLAGCSLTRNPAEPGLGPVALKSFEDTLASWKRKADEDGVDATKSIPENKEPETMPPNSPVTNAPANPMVSLAAFLNLPADASRDDVVAALENYIAGLPDAPDPALVSTLGLSADASKDDVVGALRALVPSVPTATNDEMESDPETPPTMNYDALKGAVMAAAKSVPYDNMPFMVNETPRTTRTTTYSTVNVSRNVRMPGLLDAARGALQGGMAAKAMSYGIGGTGGFILKQETSNSIIEPLRAATVLNRLGTRTQDMQGTESLTIPKMTRAPDAFWVGESQTAPDDQPNYGTITLYPKPLAAIMKVPYKMLNNFTPQAEEQIRRQLLLSLQLKIDFAALVGVGAIPADGTSNGAQPPGLLTISGVTKTSLGTNGANATFQDLVSMNGRIDDANVPSQGTRAFVFSDRTKRGFTAQTDDQGRPLMRAGWSGAADKTLIEFPYQVTNLVPNNVTQGTSNAASYLFCGEWGYSVLGISTQTEIRVLNETYAASLSAGLLVYVYVDFQVDYPEAFQVLTGVL